MGRFRRQSKLHGIVCCRHWDIRAGMALCEDDWEGRERVEGWTERGGWEGGKGSRGEEFEVVG